MPQVVAVEPAQQVEIIQEVIQDQVVWVCNHPSLALLRITVVAVAVAVHLRAPWLDQADWAVAQQAAMVMPATQQPILVVAVVVAVIMEPF
jgi:hypothetical protein